MATLLPQENTNFLRLAGLLIRIAPRAVRRLFDKEFHPNQLNQFLRKNRPKIDDLTFRKRVITQAEYELLYPKGSVGVLSDMFDVSLMVCLLRNFTDLDIQDSLPLKTNLTSAADISRIKFYRNYIVHSESGEVTANKFTVIWKCVEEAILRLLPELKPEIDALICSLLTNVGDIKHVLRLEKELEKTNQQLGAINQKLETLEIKNSNAREIRHKILKEWRETDKKYVSTSAKTFIFKSLQSKRGVVITGSPGCGKSATAHHVAFELEKDGYEIFPCDYPSEILDNFSSGNFQVFVLDDVCGKFTLDKQKADSWDQYDGKLNMLLELNRNDDKEDSSSKSEKDKMSKSKKDSYIKFDEDLSRKSQTKFIITSRENIYVHKAFPKLTCLSLVQCSLSTNYKMSLDEMQKIAVAYGYEDTPKDIQNICLYDFFPLICALYCKSVNRDPRFFTHPVEIVEKEISEMKIKSQSSFVCLSLLVLRNNNISKDEIRSGDVEQIIKDICWDCEIEAIISMVSIQKSFECFNDIYIIEAEEKYTAIHDKMFDIIAAAIAPSIMKCLIKYGDIVFLANRIQFLSLGRSSLPFVVHIPQELEINYLNRIYKEALSGKYWEVFGSIQTEKKTFRNLLISFLKEQDTCKQTSYAISEDGPTPLFVSSSLGYENLVEYFIAICRHHIDVKDKEGRSPFYVACKNGHIDVVKYLIKFYKDVNAEMAYGTTALSATSCTEVAQLLLDNNADINRTNKSNNNALHYACRDGNVQMVNLLFSAYNLGITIRDINEQTYLHTVYQTTQQLTFKQFCRDVNQQSDLGWTPLFIACYEGHYETAKLLLELNRQTCHSCVDLTIKDNKGYSNLHAACENGRIEVVKILIDVGMNVNDTSNEGLTPLHVACKKGHYDTVKLLLDLKGKTCNSCVDTRTRNKDGWSVLHVACSEGHTEVVKLLIDVGLNVNDRTNHLHTPLLLACYHGHFETVKYLLYPNGKTFNNRVDVTMKHENGWSVLHAACSNGHTEIVKLLIKFGSNLKETIDDGSTPFDISCCNGQYDTVKYLLALKGKLLEDLVCSTSKIKNGWSALHGACSGGHTEVVKLLVDAGIDINATLNCGNTPLHLACENGHYDTVIFLLNLNGQTPNSSVDTTIKNLNGQSVIHVACSKGHTKVVKLFFEFGLYVDDTSKEGVTPLSFACREGHIDTVKLLLDWNGQTLNSCVNTTTRDKHGCSALYAACSNGQTEIVKLLIDVGLNVNDTCYNGHTPLCAACKNGQYDTVKYLLDLNYQTLNSRVDTTIRDVCGRTALHAACANGHTEVIKLLVGVGMNMKDTANMGYSALHLACEGGHYDTVKYLINLKSEKFEKTGAGSIKNENDTVKCLLELNGQTGISREDIFIKSEIGWSALHTACFHGHVKVVQLLIEVGMNVNDQTNDLWTPLFFACMNGHYETVKFLLYLKEQKIKSYVDIPKHNIEGRSALHVSFSRGHVKVVEIPKHNIEGWSALHVSCSRGHVKVVELLVDFGMDVNATTYDRLTPLYIACGNGQFDTVKFLLALNGQILNSRVNTATKDSDGGTALHAACSNGHTEVVKLLVGVGMNINDKTNSNETPLYIACNYGYNDTVKWLMHLTGETSKGPIDTTIKNIDGLSVLHAACSGGNTEIIKLLIGVGLNTNDRSYTGFTPLHLACLNGHSDAVRCLLGITDEALKVQVDSVDYYVAKLKGHEEIVMILTEHLGYDLCVIS